MPRHAGRWLLCACLSLIPISGCAETHFEAAQRLLEAGHDTEARRALELELSLRPGNLEARYDLAVLLERIGHGAEAAALYRNNLKRGRNLPSLVNLSAWLRSQGEHSAAEALLLKGTKDYPDEAVPWYLLAEMAQQAGNNGQAHEDYLQALRADNRNGYAHLRFARFLAASGDIDQAISQAATAVHLLPGCAPCLDIAGDIYARAGHRERALALWQKSIAIAPSATLRDKIVQAEQTRKSKH